MTGSLSEKVAFREDLHKVREQAKLIARSGGNFQADVKSISRGPGARGGGGVRV